jgi:hypothetical protein
VVNVLVVALGVVLEVVDVLLTSVLLLCEELVLIVSV